ncbi:MAG: 50S ribosomal protein L24 [Eubacteriales bacterium]|jgi:large subunit ribosomal protein L24|nr:50S ribosomal protein L24 [Eubacteriales bacterium]
MPTTCHIRRNDLVVARSGTAAADGKTGKVLQVFPRRGRAVVEGFNFIHKTLRKSQDNPQGGIIRKEASLAISKLMLYCPHCKQGVRISRRITDQGRKVRQCKQCQHAFDG